MQGTRMAMATVAQSIQALECTLLTSNTRIVAYANLEGNVLVIPSEPLSKVNSRKESKHVQEIPAEPNSSRRAVAKFLQNLVSRLEELADSNVVKHARTIPLIIFLFNLFMEWQLSKSRTRKDSRWRRCAREEGSNKAKHVATKVTVVRWLHLNAHQAASHGHGVFVAS